MLPDLFGRGGAAVASASRRAALLARAVPLRHQAAMAIPTFLSGSGQTRVAQKPTITGLFPSQPGTC